MVSTIASLIRDNAAAILALAAATKPDGSRYLYKDILLVLGLPTTPSHIREVSKLLNKHNQRRRANFTRSQPQPDGGLLPSEEPQDFGIYVHIEASEVMDALAKVRDACSVLQQIIQKTLDDPVYDRG